MTKETIDAMTWRSGSDLGFFQLSGEHGTCLRAAASHALGAAFALDLQQSQKQQQRSVGAACGSPRR
jgi:hypothetical protein